KGHTGRPLSVLASSPTFPYPFTVSPLLPIPWWPQAQNSLSLSILKPPLRFVPTAGARSRTLPTLLSPFSLNRLPECPRIRSSSVWSLGTGRRPTRRRGTCLHQIGGCGNHVSQPPRLVPSFPSRSSAAPTTLCVGLRCALQCPCAAAVPR
uniref:Uncharacterized protein n=1 Tax=Triticum urartu TaxID=4572 RepID=A0A8R7QU15_TRIUA